MLERLDDTLAINMPEALKAAKEVEAKASQVSTPLWQRITSAKPKKSGCGSVSRESSANGGACGSSSGGGGGGGVSPDTDTLTDTLTDAGGSFKFGF